MPDFILHALLAGIGVAIVAGTLGVFVVWRKMSYFGDTLAHSALIGVAIGFVLDINITIAIVFASFIVAGLLFLMDKQQHLPTDTLLGILSHGSLALGLVGVSLLANTRINLYGYLFGDFLTVSRNEIFVIYGIVAIVLSSIFLFWKKFLALTVDEDLAQVEGIAVDKLRLLLMFLIALVIAVSMKIVGVLLITALLIIPAAASRQLSSSPEAMVAGAMTIAILSVLGGIKLSWDVDIPPGPAVVLCSTIIFALSLLKKQR